jgi:hypothetical protein
MDINSLLSPSESPIRQQPSANSNSSAKQRSQPRPAGSKRAASGLSNEIMADAPRSVPTMAQEPIDQAQRSAFQSGYASVHEVRTPDMPSTSSPFGTPQLQRPQLQYVSNRPSSTPHMDTLAAGARLSYDAIVCTKLLTLIRRRRFLATAPTATKTTLSR